MHVHVAVDSTDFLLLAMSSACSFSLPRMILLRVIISKIIAGELASKMFYSFSFMYPVFAMI